MITEADLRRILADAQEQQRRIIREELALALELYAPKGTAVAPSKIPTPALNAAREMSARDRIDAIVRSPDMAAMAQELFKRSRKPARSRKAAA